MSIRDFFIFRLCFWCIDKEKIGTLRYLIRKYSSLNFYVVNDDSLLSYAYLHKREYVKPLLEIGAYPNIRDTAGSTVLMMACGCGDREIVKLLIEHGADVNLTDNLGDTALSYSNKNGHIECSVFLKENGALK